MYKGIKGKYKVKNVGKCANGDTVEYKSKYEYRMMTYLDTSDSIVKWGYEVLKIAYISPVDSKQHMYEVDFYVIAVGEDGKLKKIAIEVKPLKQVLPPTGSKRSKKTVMIEQNTYQLNQAKWMYARGWCKDNDVSFITITENELYPFMSRQSTNKKIK